MRRSFCAAGLLCLGLGALPVSGGCGPPTTGMRGEAPEKLKEQVVARSKKLKAFYQAKNAEIKAKKTNTRAR